MMDNLILIKKYAYNYLSRYNSTKKNLSRILKNKILRMNNVSEIEKKRLIYEIKNIVASLEKKNIIDDDNFAETKVFNLINQGKSENYIKNILYIKGINKDIINKIFLNLQNENPEWENESAKKFANKYKLGKFGNNKNKQKDIAKMARAGFNYQLTLKTLGYN
tara:strand:- start:2714 stop:3205 length:492 start_codon:yes stop_codon:yes gene_type:complete